MSERSVTACVQWGALCFVSPATHLQPGVCLPTDLLDNICRTNGDFTGHLTCQPSPMERLLSKSMLSETCGWWYKNGSISKETTVGKLTECGYVNILFVANSDFFFSLKPKATGLPILFFYKASFWQYNIIFIYFIGVASVSFCVKVK